MQRQKRQERVKRKTWKRGKSKTEKDCGPHSAYNNKALYAAKSVKNKGMSAQ